MLVVKSCQGILKHSFRAATWPSVSLASSSTRRDISAALRAPASSQCKLWARESRHNKPNPFTPERVGRCSVTTIKVFSFSPILQLPSSGRFGTPVVKMTTTKPRSVLREASHQIIAGGSAGKFIPLPPFVFTVNYAIADVAVGDNHLKTVAGVISRNILCK